MDGKLILKRHQKIQRIAHSYWEKAGCPEGKDLEFWLAAEKKVDKNYAPRFIGYFYCPYVPIMTLPAD